jgi:hypothetical protein
MSLLSSDFEERTRSFTTELEELFVRKYWQWHDTKTARHAAFLFAEIEKEGLKPDDIRYGMIRMKDEERYNPDKLLEYCRQGAINRRADEERDTLREEMKTFAEMKRMYHDGDLECVRPNPDGSHNCGDCPADPCIILNKATAHALDKCFGKRRQSGFIRIACKSTDPRAVLRAHSEKFRGILTDEAINIWPESAQNRRRAQNEGAIATTLATTPEKTA